MTTTAAAGFDGSTNERHTVVFDGSEKLERVVATLERRLQGRLIGNAMKTTVTSSRLLYQLYVSNMQVKIETKLTHNYVF